MVRVDKYSIFGHWCCMQVNTTLTTLNISEQDPPIGAEGEAALVAALQVRAPCPLIDAGGARA
jgi:hypothetical protein